MRAFWRGAADAGRGVDAKLVRLHIPAQRLAIRRKNCVAQATEAREQCMPSWLRQRALGHGFEPALNAAVQGVVFHWLPVRAMGHGRPGARLHFETAMAPTAVVAAIEQVVVGRQIVPVARQLLELKLRRADPARQIGAAEQRKTRL